MDGKRSVEVTIAGHKLPIRTESPLGEVQAAAELVEQKLGEVTTNRANLSNQTLLLLALNLADEHLKLKRSSQTFQKQLLQRSEALISELDEHFGLEP